MTEDNLSQLRRENAELRATVERLERVILDSACIGVPSAPCVCDAPSGICIEARAILARDVKEAE